MYTLHQQADNVSTASACLIGETSSVFAYLRNLVMS